MEERRKVLSVRDLEISFTTSTSKFKAIRGARFDLYEGENLAIVGESGSGKSVTVKAVMGILSSNGTIDKGSIKFFDLEDDEEYEIVGMSQKKIREKIAGKKIAMIFQDPMTSLDPTMTVGKQIMEGMRYHYKTSKAEARKKAIELLKEVGIDNAKKRMKQYPNQLSGGMRQRVVIAIALACDPSILICDEPTTALDVTVQSKILELIRSIQIKKNLSVIYITHDLGVVAKVADYVTVMYAGKVIEKGSVDEVFYEPIHPYTWGLLSSIPDINVEEEELYSIPGNPINLALPFEGDAFAPRNKHALAIDFKEDAPQFDAGGKHRASTWLLDPRAPKVEMPESLKRRIEKMKEEVENFER